MKVPAIKGNIGDWVYYTTNLTFEQISENVSRVDDELHKSKSLNELIQRSITNNFKNIKSYILNQPEVFFNALVLAVYDSYPDWIEVELTFETFNTYQVGLLDFPTKHKIFPIDGQHRVEGIKAALKENPELKVMQIPVIFVGHRNDSDGLKRTRRLFSTLNRYAKPVTMDDIIALDEDDSIAIITRDLIENYKMFEDSRIVKTQSKAIPTEDKKAFTSIITLYECNREILKNFRQREKDNKTDFHRDLKFNDYLKFRPSDEELEAFKEYTYSFWNNFATKIVFIKDYLDSTSYEPALPYRNSKDGGNLLFRPIGLLPFVKAVFKLERLTKRDIGEIMTDLANQNLTLNKKPWNKLVWNDVDNVMIMANKDVIDLVLIFKYDKALLKENELKKLKNKYINAFNLNEDETHKVIDLI